MSESILPWRGQLPWYDFDELRGATDAFWGGVTEELAQRGWVGLPPRPERGVACRVVWRDPRLLLSQACGYDIALPERDHLLGVATPMYRLPGAPRGCYRSLLLVRSSDPARSLGDLRGRTCVINGRTSHSGMNALRELVRREGGPFPFFSGHLVSGSHAASLRKIHGGEADVASIDEISFRLLTRVRGALVEGLRSLGTTPWFPAPPWVTSRHRTPEEVEVLRDALHAACAAPALRAAREALLLEGALPLDMEGYSSMIELEQRAVREGCREFST